MSLSSRIGAYHIVEKKINTTSRQKVCEFSMKKNHIIYSIMRPWILRQIHTHTHKRTDCQFRKPNRSSQTNLWNDVWSLQYWYSIISKSYSYREKIQKWKRNGTLPFDNTSLIVFCTNVTDLKTTTLSSLGTILGFLNCSWNS